MKIELSTLVKGDYRKVFGRFNKELLQQLEPPGMSVKLIRYDEPTIPGAQIHIQTSVLGLIKQSWEVVIAELEENPGESFFVDHGKSLPFPLKQWRHKHIVRDAGQSESGEPLTEIVDDITYSAGWLTPLMLPIVWGQFAWRRPRYRKIFGAP